MMFGGLLTLLLFGALFYVLMRYGCGAHMVHGSQGAHQAGRGVSAVAGDSGNDPVCGMTVEPGHGYAENREGREYHFCSRKCLDKFDAEPQHYIS